MHLLCAEGGVSGGREVVCSTVPALLSTWDTARGEEDRRQILASLATILTAAATTGNRRSSNLNMLR